MASRRNHRSNRNDASSSSSRESACAVLGIPAHATEEEGRRAYRSLARAFHPDKGGDVKRFQAVQRAYESLAAAWNRDRDDRRRAAAEASKKGGRGGRGGSKGGVATQRQQQQRQRGQRPSSSSDAYPSTKTTNDVDNDDDNNNNASPAGASTSSTAPHPATTAAEQTAAAAMIPSCDLGRLGDEALAAGDFSRAVECYDAALSYARLDGGVLSYASLYYSRGCALAGLKRWKSALRDADKAVAIRGLWLAPRLLRGRALEATGRWTAAAECYQSARELSSQKQQQQQPKKIKKSGRNSRSESCTAEKTERTNLLTDEDAVTAAAAADEEEKEKEKEKEVTAIFKGWRRTQRALTARSCVAELSGHAGSVTTVAFMSGRGHHRQILLLASASDDNAVRLWSIPDGECRLVLRASSSSSSHVPPASVPSRPQGGSSRSSTAPLDPIVHLKWGPEPLLKATRANEKEEEEEEEDIWCLAATTVSGALTLWHIRVSSSSSPSSSSSSVSTSSPEPSTTLSGSWGEGIRDVTFAVEELRLVHLDSRY